MRSTSALLFACVFCLPAFGQVTATITGRITDPSGNIINGAKVTATNITTGAQASGTSAAGGDYTIPLLNPGTYSVAAEATGFKKSVRENIELHVNDKTTVDFKLELGQVQESVTVSEEAPLLDEATATRGNLIENLRVTELPLNGRNPFMLANLSPGVQFNGNPVFTRPFDNGDNANFAINGGVRQENGYLIDGSPDDAYTDPAADRTHSNFNVAFIPVVDSTQEFKIVTNFYDAQYGRTGGGIINVTTKHGANEYHGTIYEFMRRYQLDANNSGANAAGRPVYVVDPVTGKNLGGHKLDQYGIEIGGPASIPKVFKAKDKLFFMFGFENYRESTPSPGLTSVPTLAERNGDFSADGITMYNPFTTRANPNYNPAQPQSVANSPFIRDQFPNNVIPQSLINTVGRNIANAYPAPNVGSPTQRFNNYLSSPNLSLDKFRSFIGRVDQNLGDKERLFYRYAHNRRDQYDQGTAVFPGVGFDAQDPLIRTNDNAAVGSTTVLTPNMLLDIHAGFTRYIEAAYRSHVYGYNDTLLGFPASFSSARFDPIPPRIQLEQYGTDFGTRNQRFNSSNIVSLLPGVTWVHGRHSIKLGADLRDIRVNPQSASTLWGGGQFHFSRDYTSGTPGITNASSGSAVASLLLGTPDSGIIQYAPKLAYRWGYYGVYFQDDVKVSSKLTINWGVRWDNEGSPSERFNRMNRGWNFATASPLAPAVRGANLADCPACANLTGGLFFAGANGQPRSAFNSQLANWQPRAGVAYQVAKSTVLRGGYGVFFMPEAAYGGDAGFAADTAFVSTIGGGANAYIPVNTLSNPFPNGFNQPTGSSAGLNTFLGQNVIFNNPNRSIPHVDQYSAGIEHQLPKNIKLDAEYVASRAYNVNTNDNNAGGARNLNALPLTALQQAQQNPSYLTQAVPNPFAGMIPGNATLNSPTIQRQFLLKPYPQFGNVLMGQESIGRIWYDSLQLTAEKRYSAGLVLVAAYTWSKNIEQLAYLNDQDLSPVKNLTAGDRPQRFVLSGVYTLPFGRGMAFAKNVNRGVNMLIGGWEYNFIGTIQSGTPLGLNGNVTLIGNPAISNQTSSQWFNTCVLSADGKTTSSPDPTNSKIVTGCSNPAWQILGPNMLRTIPFRIGSLRSPSRAIWDMAFDKKVLFTERYNFQFRFEAFNVFNTPIRNSPDLTPTNPTFGLISIGQSNIPRQVQLGFKLNF